MNISFLQIHFQNIMAGMWFSGRSRDKHERGGLRYAAAALAAAPAAPSLLATLELQAAPEPGRNTELLLGSTALRGNSGISD